MDVRDRLLRFVRSAGPARRWPHFVGAAAGSLLPAILSIALSGRPSAAQARQDFLTANIDSTVSPREDFFQYADGAWLERNPIPQDQSRWGIWNVAIQAIDSQLKDISRDAAASNAPRGSAQRLIGDVWATGMDSATINRQGLAPLQPDLDRIDRIRSIGDLIDFVATLHRRGMLIDNVFGRPRVLFADDVVQDESQSDRWIYSLSPGGLSMGRMAYSATDPRRTKVRDAFREYLLKTFLRLHQDSAEAKGSADAVYDLEARLATGFGPDNQSHRMGLPELKQLTPMIDWDRYLQGVGITRLDSITVRNPRFFQTLDSLLRTANLDAWKHYLQFWLIKVNAPFLDDATFRDFFAYKHAVTGQEQPGPRWKRVVFEEKNWFGLALASLYVEEYYHQSEMARYQALGEAIRQAAQARIEHLDWMSDSTKHNALLKLSRLKITVGYPERRTDLSTMSLRRDSYVLNMIRSAEWFHDQEIGRLGTPVDRAEADLHPDIGDESEYDYQNNEVVLTPVIPPGVPDQALDDAFVYGSTALGHEISHAFDSEGRNYDAYGNKVDWWTARDAAAFDQRAQTLIDEYNAFTPLKGLHVDGRRSVRENMADLLGLRIALDAFKETDEFKKNERVGGFTPLQRFFLAYAYGHMGHESNERLARMARGTHAPDRERVNGVVMNIPEFYEAFNVKPGDPMYRPESARVKIW